MVVVVVVVVELQWDLTCFLDGVGEIFFIGFTDGWEFNAENEIVGDNGERDDEADDADDADDKDGKDKV